MGFINEQMDSQSFDIGKIEIFSNFSFFEIEKEHGKAVMNVLNKADFENLSVKVQFSQPKKDEKKFAQGKPARNKNQRGGNRRKNQPVQKRNGGRKFNKVSVWVD